MTFRAASPLPRHCGESAPVHSFRVWGVRDLDKGRRNLANLAERLGFDALAALCNSLARFLPRCPAPDMALNNLERFFAHPAAPAACPRVLDNRARSLEILLQLFATSQMFSDLLGQFPDYLDMLRVPLRRSPSPDRAARRAPGRGRCRSEDSAVLRAFRRFRQRQVLRIGTNDIIRDRPLEEITRDISRVADAALEVALARRPAQRRQALWRTVSRPTATAVSCASWPSASSAARN